MKIMKHSDRNRPVYLYDRDEVVTLGWLWDRDFYDITFEDIYEGAEGTLLFPTDWKEKNYVAYCYNCDSFLTDEDLGTYTYDNGAECAMCKKCLAGDELNVIVFRKGAD